MNKKFLPIIAVITSFSAFVVSCGSPTSNNQNSLISANGSANGVGNTNLTQGPNESFKDFMERIKNSGQATSNTTKSGATNAQKDGELKNLASDSNPLPEATQSPIPRPSNTITDNGTPATTTTSPTPTATPSTSTVTGNSGQLSILINPNPPTQRASK